MLPGQETWTPTLIPGQELRSHMGSQKNKHTQIPNLNYLLQAQRGQFITELFFFYNTCLFFGHTVQYVGY